MLELDTETTLPSSRLHLNHIVREGGGEVLGEKVDVEVIEVAKPANKNDSRVKQRHSALERGDIINNQLHTYFMKGCFP